MAKKIKIPKERSPFYITLIVIGALVFVFASAKFYARETFKKDAIKTYAVVVDGTNYVHNYRHNSDFWFWYNLFSINTIKYEDEGGNSHIQTYLSVGSERTGSKMKVYYNKEDPNQYIKGEAFSTLVLMLYMISVVILIFGICGTVFGWTIMKRRFSDYYRM